MTASATVSPSCVVSSNSLCSSSMSNSDNFHYSTQNWRAASSTRFIMSSNFLGIIHLQNVKRTTRARNFLQSTFPRSDSESNIDNDLRSDKNDESIVIKTPLQCQQTWPFVSKSGRSSLRMVAAGLIVAVIVSGAAGAIEIEQLPVAAPQSQVQNEAEQEPDMGETMENIPQMLSGECALEKDCKKPRIQRPNSRKAETCTIKCVGTCIRGGEGSPGEGPFNIRRPLVVFKEGFRSRRYCLVECSDICNLIGEGDDGP